MPIESPDTAQSDGPSDITPAHDTMPTQLRRKIEINYSAIDQSDLVELFEILNSLTQRAIEIQIDNEPLQNFPTKEALAVEVRRCFKIDYLITKRNGDQLSGWDTPQILVNSSVDDIKSLYFSNIHHFGAAAKRNPRNCIEGVIDFGRPRLNLDFISLPSNPTPNESNVEIFGLDEDYLSLSYAKLKDFFEERKTRRKLIHQGGVYDLFLYLIFFPIVLYFLHKSESAWGTFFEDKGNVLIAAAYIYGFVVFGVIGRLFFQYMRWIFPPVEYLPKRSGGPRLHRFVLFGFVISISAAIIWDFIKNILM